MPIIIFRWEFERQIEANVRFSETWEGRQRAGAKLAFESFGNKIKKFRDKWSLRCKIKNFKKKLGVKFEGFFFKFFFKGVENE